MYYGRHVRYSKELLYFALPIILGQLGQMFISTGDIFIAGKISTDAVAALGIANGIIIPAFVTGMGLLHGISPRLAQKLGEGEEIEKYLFSNIAYALCISLIWIICFHLILPFLHLLQFDQRLLPMVREYIHLFSFSLIGAYIFQAVREYLQAKEIVFLPNLLMIISVGLNLVLNYVFVFGWQGVPAMGFSGLAIASIVVRILLALVICVVVIRTFKVIIVPVEYFISLLKLSIPIALSIFLEVSAFSFASLIIAIISSEQVAAHTLVLNLSALAYMVPLSISTALAIKVGHAFGRKDYTLMVAWLRSGLILSFVFSVLMASGYYLFAESLLSIFTDNSSLVSIAIPLLYMVALFQLVDGVQVSLVGFLRGINITKLPMVISFIGYWLVGLGFGAVLTFLFDMQALGMWVGLASSLVVTCIMLSFVTRRYLNNSLG